MKKFFTVILSLFLFSGFIFAQDFGSEAEDLAELESRTLVEAEDSVESESKSEAKKDDFYIGFNLSILGVEPAFQWIHNEHLEMQGGISFIQYPSALTADALPTIGVITPMYDIGYRTPFYFMDTTFSVGGTVAFPIGVADSGAVFSGMLAIYLKVATQIGLFELGVKTYIPLLEGWVSSISAIPSDFVPAFARWEQILGGLAVTTFEVKFRL